MKMIIVEITIETQLVDFHLFNMKLIAKFIFITRCLNCLQLGPIVDAKQEKIEVQFT